jgi:hypothetical protein
LLQNRGSWMVQDELQPNWPLTAAGKTLWCC